MAQNAAAVLLVFGFTNPTPRQTCAASALNFLLVDCWLLVYCWLYVRAEVGIKVYNGGLGNLDYRNQFEFSMW